MQVTNWRCGTCLRLLAFKIDLLRGHDVQQDLECNDNVGIDDRASLPSLVFGETLRVDDAHLFDNG
jgi:hypothetical protein